MPQLCPHPKTRKRGPSVPFNKLPGTLGCPRRKKPSAQPSSSSPQAGPKKPGKAVQASLLPTHRPPPALGHTHSGDLLVAKTLGQDACRGPTPGEKSPSPAESPQRAPGSRAPRASTSNASPWDGREWGDLMETRTALATDLCPLQGEGQSLSLCISIRIDIHTRAEARISFISARNCGGNTALRKKKKKKSCCEESV